MIDRRQIARNSLLGTVLLVTAVSNSPTWAQSVEESSPEVITSELFDFSFSHNTAELMKETVSELFPNITFTADRENNILYFRAFPHEFAEVLDFLHVSEKRAAERQALEKMTNATKKPAPPMMLKMFPMKHMEPAKAIEILSQLAFDEDMLLSATESKVIAKSDSQAVMDQVADLIAEIDVPGSAQPRAASVLDNISSSNSVRTPVRPKWAQSIPQRPAENATIEEQAKAFRTQQSILRQQIELQKKKLELLEKRLNEREKLAESYFSSVLPDAKVKFDARVDNTRTSIELVPRTDLMILRGQKQNVEAVADVIEQIRDAANREDKPFVSSLDESPEEDPEQAEEANSSESGLPRLVQ